MFNEDANNDLNLYNKIKDYLKTDNGKILLICILSGFIGLE